LIVASGAGGLCIECDLQFTETKAPSLRPVNINLSNHHKARSLAIVLNRSVSAGPNAHEPLEHDVSNLDNGLIANA
jgi:hypothetical protein